MSLKSKCDQYDVLVKELFMFNSENLKVGDYIAVRMAQVFIIMVFVMGMISLGIELWTGSLPL